MEKKNREQEHDVFYIIVNFNIEWRCLLNIFDNNSKEEGYTI